MKAIILVGGFGTRLRPLTFDCPKSVVPFCNLPMVEYQLSACQAVGVKEVILAINYQPELITCHIEHLSAKYSLTITCSRETEPLGTAGPIALARTLLEKDNPEGLFFMFNSDVICDFNLEALLAKHRERGGEGTIYLKEVEDPSRFGVVVTEGDKVTRFVEKPKVFVSNLINAGCYLLSTKVIPRVPLRFCMIEKEIFPALAEEGKLFSVKLQGFWNDIGQPRDFLAGQKDYIDFLDSKGKLQGPFPKSIVDPSAVVEEGAEVGPYAVVGPKCVVRSGARVRGACLLGGTVVEKGSLVVGSIVGRSNRLGKFSRVIELSVTGSEVVVGEEVELREVMVCPQKSVGASERGKVLL